MIEYETMEDSIINPPLPQNSVEKNEQSTLDNNNLNQGQYSNITDQIDYFNTNNSNYKQNKSHYNGNFNGKNNSDFSNKNNYYNGYYQENSHSNVEFEKRNNIYASIK
jgi:hypothetical protein